MKITLDLTSNQWSEVANAVSMRAEDVLKEEHELPEADVEAWAKELQGAYEVICKGLKENGVY